MNDEEVKATAQRVRDMIEQLAERIRQIEDADQLRRDPRYSSTKGKIDRNSDQS